MREEKVGGGGDVEEGRDDGCCLDAASVLLAAVGASAARGGGGEGGPVAVGFAVCGLLGASSSLFGAGAVDSDEAVRKRSPALNGR